MSTGLTPALEYHIVNSLGWSDLRPLQRQAVQPVLRGDDCLLLAPTAGGKTEAAAFPLLSRMADENWHGLTVLYVTPLRALLNNLHPRLSGYAQWMGRSVGLWHGDVGDGERRRLMADPPDILLTTPESIEAMLVSRRVDHRSVFAQVRTVVVDELHAFAGDDRGWHLQGVLERVQHLAGRRLQRIGLTATVGNPDELLIWLGGGVPAPQSTVVSPPVETSAPAPEITLDFVGTISNAATVIAALHRGEKRLVFCDSRSQAESLAGELRSRDVQTSVSHSSLSADGRRRSEQAFAEARDCVVVATSTLELGIDVGDLDRVIQIDAPRTVSSFLQRLGRTGRRPGTARNMVFLAIKDETLLRAAGLLTLWGQGFVEPVEPPPSPRHIAAQQLLALALQENGFGARTWPQWWSDAPVMQGAGEIVRWQEQAGFLARDGELLFMGAEAERHFGRRYFMDLLAAFTSEPLLTVLHGRQEIGSVSPVALCERLQEGSPRLLMLAGHSWLVTFVDWTARTVSVIEHHGGGRSQWQGGVPGLSLAVSRAMRDVLLGEEPPVAISQRAVLGLARCRTELAGCVDSAGLVLEREGDGSRWWTWAGTAANASLVAALGARGIDARANEEVVWTSAAVGVEEVRSLSELLDGEVPPEPAIDADALEGLKFSAALPADVARKTLAERMTDHSAAARVAGEGLVVR